MTTEVRHKRFVPPSDETATVLRYLAYAEEAFEEGYPEIGDLFERAARRRVHAAARNPLRPVPGIGDTEQNLRQAIARETADLARVYARMGRYAGSADEGVAAQLCDHARATEALLAELRHAYGSLRRAEATDEGEPEFLDDLAAEMETNHGPTA
jgi:rubrerythrin